jgi:hypothetical protein
MLLVFLQEKRVYKDKRWIDGILAINAAFYKKNVFTRINVGLMEFWPSMLHHDMLD